MGREGSRKEMRMFTRSNQALAIIFTVIKRTESFPQTRGEKSGGITINVSQGGLCMVTEEELEESEVIRIELPITETFLAAPTLAQVKWVNNLRNNYQVGLAYLF